jgi:regulator of replication initiation timing
MIDELIQELRSYPAHYVAAHRAAAALEQREYYNCRLEADLVKLEAAAESLREHIAQQQLDIVTLGLEVGKLREALREIEWSNNSAWQSDRARAALGEEK